MRGAKRVVYKYVAQGGQLARQRFGIFFLADIEAAVFKQHHLARFDADATCTIHPIRHQGHVAFHDLAKTLRDGGQRILRLEFAFHRPTQMGGDHDGSTRIQRHLDARHRRPDARVFSDVAVGVERHVQISTDKNTLAFDKALGAQIRKTDEVHVWLGKLNRSGHKGQKHKL